MVLKALNFDKFMKQTKEYKDSIFLEQERIDIEEFVNEMKEK